MQTGIKKPEIDQLRPDIGITNTQHQPVMADKENQKPSHQSQAQRKRVDEDQRIRNQECQTPVWKNSRKGLQDVHNIMVQQQQENATNHWNNWKN